MIIKTTVDRGDEIYYKENDVRNINLFDVGASFINKKAPVRRLFEPEAFHLKGIG